MRISQLKEMQPEVIKILNNSIIKDKLVHAYIFEGDRGTGCFEAALYFAAMVLCEHQPPCLECHTCTRVLQKEHTNLQIVEPVKDTIKKEQITELIKEFSMSSMEAGSRIYIINEAEKLNTSSANALLKFLEEPVPNRYAIIITNNHKNLLDTIVSRCQLIHFKPLPKINMIEYYKNLGINEDVAYVLSNLTSDYDEATKMINDGVITDLIELAKKINDDRNKNKNVYISFYTKSKVLKEINTKDIHEKFINILMMICRERIKYLNNQTNYYFSNIVNRTSHKKESLSKVIKELEIYSKYQERIKHNVNIDLQYASMFLELEKEAY